MTTKTLRKMIAAMGVATMTMAAGSAVAAGVSYFPPITNFQDDNLEWFTDVNPLGTAGVMDVGDRFQGVLEFTETFGEFGGGPAGFGGGELTGIFDWTVVSKVSLGGGQYSFGFAPTAGGALSAYGPGAMIAMYLDPTPELALTGTTCTSFADCNTKATDGSLYAVVGYTGDADEFAAYAGADNIGFMTSVGGGTVVASGNFGFGIIVNNAGVMFNNLMCLPSPATDGGDQLVKICGSSDVLGGQGLTNGAVARGDIDFQVAVPEPESLALVSLALLGLGASMRKRKV